MLQAQLNRSHTTTCCSRGAAQTAAHKSWLHQRPCQQRHINNMRRGATEDGPVGGEDLSDIMKQDMERFAARQQQQQAAAGSSSSSSRASEQGAADGGGSFKEVIDKVLIADFFVVLAILAWLAVGLVEKATVQSSNLIDAWLPLWPMVFQPAIGILMAGALVSGGLNWVQEQQQKK